MASPLLHRATPVLSLFMCQPIGKPTVVANAHIKCITSLPIITGTHPNRVHEFYGKLIVSTQALDTMNKLKDINGYVKITLDKLPGIRADLVRLHDDWQDWGLLS